MHRGCAQTLRIYALDAATGREIWQYARPRNVGFVGDAAIGLNRGVAVRGDLLFTVTDHAHAIALDRWTGDLVWEQEMADSSQHYGAIAAPLVVDDIVYFGISGGDTGLRGFLDAYYAETGELAWRFWTIPAAGEPGSETWGDEEVLAKRNFTAGSSRVHCTTCCVHWVLPVQARPSTCHGYGNSLRRIDSEQVEGLALEGGGLGGDGDGGLRLGGQGEPVQSDGGEIPQQGREAVHGKPLRCGLGVGLVLGAIGDLRRFDGRVAPGAHRDQVVVLEQQRSQPPSHVPFDVIGEHAQEDMPAHVVLAVDVDRADPQMILARVEGAFHVGEALVGLDSGLGG